MTAGATPPTDTPRLGRQFVFGKPGSLPPPGDPISPAQLVSHIKLREQDRADRWQRLAESLITVIIGAFVCANLGVLVLISFVWHAQVNGPPAAAGLLPPRPIITEDVVLRLITAISAQLGALAVAVGAALYQQRPRQ